MGYEIPSGTNSGGHSFWIGSLRGAWWLAAAIISDLSGKHDEQEEEEEETMSPNVLWSFSTSSLSKSSPPLILLLVGSRSCGGRLIPELSQGTDGVFPDDVRASRWRRTPHDTRVLLPLCSCQTDGGLALGPSRAFREIWMGLHAEHGKTLRSTPSRGYSRYWRRDVKSSTLLLSCYWLFNTPLLARSRTAWSKQ